MRIDRRFTQAGRDPYAGIAFAPRTSKIVNPNGSTVFEMTDIMVPESWSQVAVDILAQKYFRKAGVASKTVKVGETGVPEWLQRRDSGRGHTLRRRDRLPARLQPPGRVLDVLGLEGRVLHVRGRRPHVLRRNLPHARRPDGGPEQPAVVQHRPALGLRHRGPAPGPLLRRSRHETDGEVGECLRTAAAARVLHSVGLGRPGERRRHHGPLGPRGPHLQVRLGHRLELLGHCAAKASRSPAAASRPA